VSCRWCGDAATAEGYCAPPAWCAHNARYESQQTAKSAAGKAATATKRASGKTIITCRQCGKPAEQPVRGRRLDCLDCSAAKTRAAKNEARAKYDAKKRAA
jgi:hypothetical protein